MGGIEVSHLQKHFTRSSGELVAAVDDVSLRVESGEFCVLLGPSGCGKTTLLRSIAGLEQPSKGRIVLNSEIVYSSYEKVALATRHRNIGMVFQTYALWPHMRVKDNVAFPLTTKHWMRSRSDKKRRDERVRQALAVVGIENLADQAISALSGGQQQRVALARAIVSGSDTILFDEPLSNVDAKVRVQLREEIHRLQRELRFTALYVTHDQEEAMELADRLVVLRNGRIEQQGSPKEIYRSPASSYVADFVGTSDLLTGTVTSLTESDLVVTTEIGELVVSRVAGESRVGDRVNVAIRAEDWLIRQGSFDEKESCNSFLGTVEHAAFLGASSQYLVRIGQRNLRVRAPSDREYDGRTVRVHVPPRNCRLLGDR